MRTQKDINRLYALYAVTSITLVLAIILSIFKNDAVQWRHIGRFHNRLLRAQGLQPERVQHRQIWVRDLDRIDRCISCHRGVSSQTMAYAPQPLRSHPNVYHDVEEMGCTICHGGQGLATTITDAHFEGAAWEEPVLPQRLTESQCGRCHITEDLKETPRLNQGRKLIEDLNCSSCHELPITGNAFTPRLDGIGDKVIDAVWLDRWLRNPQVVRNDTKMPNFYLTEGERRSLLSFLVQFKTYPANFQLERLSQSYTRNKTSEEMITDGRTLFRESPCTACHKLDGQGGGLATDLDGVGSKVREQWLYTFIRDPQALQPGIEMPQFGFSTREIESITAYCSLELLEWDALDSIEGHVYSDSAASAGRAVFTQYNCTGCHTLSEVEITENRGPDHHHIGSKRLAQIWFGETSIPRTLHDYIESKLQSPRIFGESMRMPEFHLSENERIALTNVLLSFKETNLPENMLRRGLHPNAFQPQGRMGEIFERLSCTKCHTVLGDGGEVAPDLSKVGSRLNPAWLRDFLAEPVSRRPLIEERMPELGLTRDEIATIEAFFNTFLLDDRVTLQDWNPSDVLRRQGRRLFWESYGCHGCHSVDGSGGFVGPPLDDVGSRIRPEWMFHWLLDPQSLIPGTIEPRTGMSEEEALAIVAYMIRL